MDELINITTCLLEPPLFEFEEFQPQLAENNLLRSITTKLFLILVAIVVLPKVWRHIVRKHRYAWWISSDVPKLVCISGGESLTFSPCLLSMM